VSDETATEPEPRRRRGSIALYAVAFGLMLAAAACLIIGSLGILSIVDVAESSIVGTQRILRIASFLAGGAIVAAVLSVLVPRRSP